MDESKITIQENVKCVCGDVIRRYIGPEIITECRCKGSVPGYCGNMSTYMEDEESNYVGNYHPQYWLSELLQRQRLRMGYL